MAAAAAEETADVNARPFIGRRRLGASRDGAGALRAWLARTGRTDLRMRGGLRLGLDLPWEWLRRGRGVASSVPGPRARVRRWVFRRRFFRTQLLPR